LHKKRNRTNWWPVSLLAPQQVSRTMVQQATIASCRIIASTE
jgi:hypothetical protein